MEKNIKINKRYKSERQNDIISSKLEAVKIGFKKK